ncbi:YaaC family protein [Microbacteriaceae bacterium 4G12]
MDPDRIWQQLTFFMSASHSQNYLSQCYKSLGIIDREKRSFENCYPFIYYLEHGQSYYKLSRECPLSIKPVLLFYGMIQLLKACLLTVDPNYPESTSVLAHGVTTRKRKKQGYEFLQDEVKIQKNGLFTHITERMFHMKHFEGEKFSMEILLKRIAELADLLTHSKKTSGYHPIKRIDDETIAVPHSILDGLHMTKDRFIEYFQTVCSHLSLQCLPVENNEFIFFRSPMKNWNGLVSSPLTYNIYKDTYYFPENREFMTIFPELLAHYLLLYNLSMISRYETEWWSDLLHSYATEDYPFIHQFLSISADKVPYFIYLYLIEKTRS